MLVLMVALIAWGNAWGYDLVAGGIYYNITSETDLTVEVTYRFSIFGRIFYSGDIVIPSSVTDLGKTYSVTSIGDGAFYDCDGLTSITIPNSVTSIENRAFSGCNSLTNIMVENGNTVYDSRENCNAIIETTTNTLIVGCKNTLIPNSVTSIGDGAFYDCDGLTSITIPNSVTSIGDGAFYDCDGLTSITIPNSVTSIGYQAFCYCDGLTSITIPNSVTSIGESAFWNCDGLTSITIPNSVTSIGNQAFCDCDGLTSITIPNSVTSIGTRAFDNCENLTSIKVEEGNPIYESRDENHAVVQKSDNSVVTKIPREISVCVASSTQTTLTLQVLHEESKSFESCGIEVGFRNKYEADSDGYIVLTEKVPNKSGIIYSITEVYAIYDGISYTVEKVNNLEYTTKDITAEVIVQSSPTTVTLSGDYDVGDATFEASGFTLPQSVEGNTLALTGLEPKTSTEVSYYVTVKEGNYTKTVTQTVTTPALKMTTLPAKATSNTKAVICAETNIVNEETGTGFEFRRIDAPDLVPSTIVYCAVHDGVMEGILNNLSANTYYKYRPFYKSASGKMYYGEWIGFGTADAYVYFTPTVHTYATAGVESNSVTLNGYALPGSDDILEQGFEYWTDGFVGTRAAGEVITVAATGQRMSITLNDLQYNTTYRYRAYVKTAKETTYGEEMTFTTGADPAGIGDVAAEDLDIKVRTVQGGIELCLTGEPATVRYALYTLNGTSIANGQLTSGEEWQRVGDSSLPQGLYLLRVENNKLCRTVKVMVK